MPKHVRYFLSQQRKYIIPFFIVVLVSASIVTFRSYIYGELFNNLTTTLQSKERQTFFVSLYRLSGTEIALFVWRIFYDMIYTTYRGYMNLFVRIHGVDRIIEMDYTNLAKIGSGRLLQIVHSGMESYSFLIYDGGKNLIELVISLVVVLYIIGMQNVRFVIGFAGCIFILYFFQKYAFHKLADRRNTDKELNELYTKQTAKILTNFILLKIFGIKDTEIAQLEKHGKDRIKNYTVMKLWFTGVSSMANLLLMLFSFVALGYLGWLFLNAKIAIGTIMFFLVAIIYARERFYAFGVFVAEMTEKLTFITRFDEILAQAQTTHQDNMLNLTHLKEDIHFEDISFSYEESKQNLFDQLSLLIPYGQKAAFVGRSGSGKSTLFKILTRLVDPQQGNLRLGQNPLQTISYESIYKHIGYFFQEPLVFDGTLRENLCLNTLFADEQLQVVLHDIHLDHLTLDTMIGEHGLLLSGGEKQRLALARALLFDYDILLLDEPTSNLDLELEKSILLTLFKKYEGKTILIISHRPFILEYVDRIVVMKKGDIIADGPFQEVSKNDALKVYFSNTNTNT